MCLQIFYLIILSIHLHRNVCIQILHTEHFKLGSLHVSSALVTQYFLEGFVNEFTIHDCPPSRIWILFDEIDSLHLWLSLIFLLLEFDTFFATLMSFLNILSLANVITALIFY
jgi:hypothetical protein